MLGDVKKTNPKQHACIKDTAPFSSALCPRRAGKTFMAVLLTLIQGEAKPESISVIVSLNKLQLRRLYFDGPAGLIKLARRFKLNLEIHNTMLKWTHENGSIGYLLGADDDEQLEILRGLEADLYIIDECKSFPPGRLRVLVDEIITPQWASRQGRVVLIGTPGHIEAGPFFEATCERATQKYPDGSQRPYSVAFGEADPWGRTPQEHRLWSRHHWTLEDNRPMRHQWEQALITKRTKGWADDHPIWLREYLGLWTGDTDGLVYRYAAERNTGRVMWTPEPTEDNPTGLPESGAPWRLIAGMDIAFEGKTALVICGYSARLGQMRMVFEHSAAHMLPHDVEELLKRAQDRYGAVERIFCDNGGGGSMVIAYLERNGFPVEKAEKREKYDHIELINSAFTRGEILIIEDSITDFQLRTNAWDLRKGTRAELARAGRLREDDSIDNDSTDALLYCFRGSLHQFGYAERLPGPAQGTPEWVSAWEKAELKKARRAHKLAAKRDKRLGGHDFPTAPARIRQLLGPQWQSTPTTATYRRLR